MEGNFGNEVSQMILKLEPTDSQKFNAYQYKDGSEARMRHLQKLDQKRQRGWSDARHMECW